MAVGRGQRTLSQERSGPTLARLMLSVGPRIPPTLQGISAPAYCSRPPLTRHFSRSGHLSFDHVYEEFTKQGSVIFAFVRYPLASCLDRGPREVRGTLNAVGSAVLQHSG